MDKGKVKEKSVWNLLDRFSGDKVILMVTVLLMLISVISVFSSTPLLVDSGKGIDRVAIMVKQLKAVGAGLVVGILFYLLGRSKYYKAFALFGLGISLVSLAILVFNLNLGIVKAGVINGARRVILFHGKQIHVYEFVKVFMVIYIAWALDTFKRDGFGILNRWAARSEKMAWIGRPGWQKIICIYLPMFAVIVMVMMGSNSSALFLAIIMILMILIGGLDAKDVVFAVLVLGVAVGGFFLAYKAGILRDSRFGTAISRIMGDDEKLMDQLVNSPQESTAWKSARDKLKQPVGAQIAIKEGGILGKGIGNSTQKYAVPVIFGDYMFSFIIEETGIAGALFIILLYFSLLARGTLVAKDCDDYFDKMLVVGLIMLVTGQAFMHMAVNVHLPFVPQTGQTLPLVSHGTSSFLVFSAVFGMLLSISREVHYKMKQREDNAEPLLEHKLSEGDNSVGDRMDDLEALESLDDYQQ